MDVVGQDCSELSSELAIPCRTNKKKNQTMIRSRKEGQENQSKKISEGYSWGESMMRCRDSRKEFRSPTRLLLPREISSIDDETFEVCRKEYLIAAIEHYEISIWDYVKPNRRGGGPNKRIPMTDKPLLLSGLTELDIARSEWC